MGGQGDEVGERSNRLDVAGGTDLHQSGGIEIVTQQECLLAVGGGKDATTRGMVHEVALIDRLDTFRKNLARNRPKKFVAVALANKTARVAWALLAKGGTYRSPELAAA